MQRRLAILAVLAAVLIAVLGVSSMVFAGSAAHHSGPSASQLNVLSQRARATRRARATSTATTHRPRATSTATTRRARATSTAAAHRPRPLVVVLDPGHGGQMLYGDESGAANGTMLEKNLTLATAKVAQRYLQSWGYRVYLTRTTDQRVNWPQRDLNHDGKIDHVDEYDARTLFANQHHADVFVSIHYDGSTNPASHGTHGYYCPARPFWRSSQRLAGILTQSVSRAVTKAGYPDPNNGIATDVSDVVPQTRADYPWFLVLGPSRSHWITGTAMPGALIESMFVSSPADAAALRKPAIVAAVGRGYAEGIRAYFHGRHTRLP